VPRLTHYERRCGLARGVAAAEGARENDGDAHLGHGELTRWGDGTYRGRRVRPANRHPCPASAVPVRAGLSDSGRSPVVLIAFGPGGGRCARQIRGTSWICLEWAATPIRAKRPTAASPWAVWRRGRIRLNRLRGAGSRAESRSTREETREARPMVVGGSLSRGMRPVSAWITKPSNEPRPHAPFGGLTRLGVGEPADHGRGRRVCRRAPKQAARVLLEAVESARCATAGRGLIGFWASSRTHTS
jgi:hypothetical protein